MSNDLKGPKDRILNNWVKTVNCGLLQMCWRHLETLDTAKVKLLAL